MREVNASLLLPVCCYFPCTAVISPGECAASLSATQIFIIVIWALSGTLKPNMAFNAL